MFCPNCGTQNDSAATPCKKCGFKLSGISVPRFKGTMMLNSDQTVQELIEEHRRKQALGGVADKTKARASEPAAKRSPGSSAPPSSLSSPRAPVLQPPRVAAPRGRMGGTMLGVAPQAGVTPRAGEAPAAPSPAGPPLQPPTVPAASATPAAPATPTLPDPSAEAYGGEAPRSDAVEPRAAAHEPASDDGPADPLGPTTAFAAVNSDAVTPVPDADGSVPTPRMGHTLPLASVSPAEAPALDGGVPDDTPPGDLTADVEPAASEPDLRAAQTQPPRNRAVAATAVLPQQPDTVAASDASGAPPGIRPLDVVLIICTFGLYGIVLWFKQRKRPA